MLLSQKLCRNALQSETSSVEDYLIQIEMIWIQSDQRITNVVKYFKNSFCFPTREKKIGIWGLWIGIHHCCVPIAETLKWRLYKPQSLTHHTVFFMEDLNASVRYLTKPIDEDGYEYGPQVPITLKINKYIVLSKSYLVSYHTVNYSPHNSQLTS